MGLEVQTHALMQLSLVCVCVCVCVCCLFVCLCVAVHSWTSSCLVQLKAIDPSHWWWSRSAERNNTRRRDECKPSSSFALRRSAGHRKLTGIGTVLVLRARLQASARLVPVLDALSNALAAAPYLAGPTFSLADLTLLPYLSALLDTTAAAPLVSDRPPLLRLLINMQKRTSWQQLTRWQAKYQGTASQPLALSEDGVPFHT